jgi:hypothetical protein
MWSSEPLAARRCSSARSSAPCRVRFATTSTLGAVVRVPGGCLGSRLPERAPTVRVLGGNLPEERAYDGAYQQRHTDEWIEERTRREGGRHERGTAHCDVKCVGFAADRISHVGSFVLADVLLPSTWSVNAPSGLERAYQGCERMLDGTNRLLLLVGLHTPDFDGLPGPDADGRNHWNLSIAFVIGAAQRRAQRLRLEWRRGRY